MIEISRKPNHLRTHSRREMCRQPCRALLFGMAFLVAGPLCCLRVDSASAEIHRAPAPEEPKRRRKYVHPCPPGTEQFGKAPPKGGNVFCRQPVVGGYRKHGQQIRWYGNGGKRYEGDYVRGKKHGVWTIYHRNGTKKSVEVWYNGKRKSKTKFDRRGAPITVKDKDAERRSRRKKYRWRNNMKY